MEVLNFGHLGGWLFGRWDWLPNGAYSLPLLALPGIVWAYRKQSVPTLSLYVPLLAWWTVLQVFAWHLGSTPFYFVGVSALCSSTSPSPMRRAVASPFLVGITAACWWGAFWCRSASTISLAGDTSRTDVLEGRRLQAASSGLAIRSGAF